MSKLTDSNGYLSGSTLKIVAVVTMLIDHIGAVLLKPMIQDSSYFELYGRLWKMDSEQWYQVYRICRMIGRMSFPLFCFLLVEGFFYTKNRGNYIFRIFAFALLSEVVFDLAFLGRWFDFSYQNIFFTLGLGLLGMSGYEWMQRRFADQGALSYVKWLSLPGSMGLATLMRTDYGWFGVGLIFIFFLLKERPKQRGLVLSIVFFVSLWPALFSLILIHFYNGKRGLPLKYLFYVFYPLHLFVLYKLAQSLLLAYGLAVIANFG